MKQSAKRLLSLLAVFLLVFGALIIFFSFIEPEYAAVEQAKGDMLSRQDFLNQQKSIVDSVNKIVASTQGNADFVQAISLALPTSPSAAEAFHELEALATQDRLAVQTFSSGAVSSQSLGASAGAVSSTLVRAIGTLNFQMKLSGTYEDFKTFVQNVETNIRIFDVRTINVVPAAKPNQDFYNFDVAVAAYYQQSH